MLWIAGGLLLTLRWRLASVDPSQAIGNDAFPWLAAVQSAGFTLLYFPDLITRSAGLAMMVAGCGVRLGGAWAARLAMMLWGSLATGYLLNAAITGWRALRLTTMDAEGLDGPEVYANQLFGVVEGMRATLSLLLSGGCLLGVWWSRRLKRRFNELNGRKFLTPLAGYRRAVIGNRVNAIVLTATLLWLVVDPTLTRRARERTFDRIRFGPVDAPHTGMVTAIDFSPDGRQVASVANSGELRIWDAARQSLTRSVVTGRPIETMIWVRDRIIYGGWIKDSPIQNAQQGRGYVEVFDLKKDKTTTFRVDNIVTAIARIPPNVELDQPECLVVATAEQNYPGAAAVLRVHRLDDWTVIAELTGRRTITSLRWDEASTRLQFCGSRFESWKFTVDGGFESPTGVSVDSGVAGFLVADGGERLILASSLGDLTQVPMPHVGDRSIIINEFNLPGNRRSGTAPSITLSPDQQTLYAAINSTELHAIDWRLGRRLWSTRESRILGAVAVSPDGRTLAVGGHRFVQFKDAGPGGR